MNKIYKALTKNTKKIVLNIGGAASGKSYQTSKFLIDKKADNKNLKIAIVRKYMLGHAHSTKKSITLLVPTQVNKDILKEFKFFSVKNIKGVFDTIWIEEASELSEEEFEHVKTFLTDTGTIILTCNPVNGFIKRLFLKNSREVLVIRSTYKDNKHLLGDLAKDLEDLKDTNVGHYKIYTLGEFIW